MAVKLIVDSGSDILPEECARLGMIHVPLKVIFDDTTYADAVDMTHQEFYERLIECDTLPTTSQVAPGEFAVVYEQVVSAGDTAVVVTVSGKLSGTYQSAVIAADGYEGKIFVVDSANVSLGQRILALEGQELIRAGYSAEAVAQKLEKEKKRIRLMGLLDTLEYLKKGGRISSAVALAGSLLSIKPVVALEDGEVVMVGKARGSRQGNNLLRQLVEKSGGICFDKPFCLAYSGLSDALLQKYIADSQELLEGAESSLPIATIGCTIGTHVGPGAVAVAFFENDC